MDNTGDYRADNFTINYYPLPDVKSEYTLFDDNRTTPGTIDRGHYRLLHFEGKDTGKKISIRLTSEGTYPGAPAVVALNFRVNCQNAAPRSVKAGKDVLQYRFDAKTRTLEFTVRYTPGAKTDIVINK